MQASGGYDHVTLGQDAYRVVGIDGCPITCTKKTLEHARLSITDHVVATNLSLVKKPQDGTIDAGAVTRVKNAVKGRLDSIAGGQY